MPFPQSPHAPVNIRFPIPPGICDRCGFKWQLRDLQFQYEYAGFGLVNTGSKVCPTCLDKPNPQLKAIRVGPDPVPIVNPRPYNYQAQMQGQGTAVPVNPYLVLTDETGDYILDSNGNTITLQPNP